MSLRINDIAPDFTAASTQGKIQFHQWLGDSWGMLFSHPKDFTPVCTTELGYMAGLSDDFAKRHCKIIGLSVDPVEDHKLWQQDIEDIQAKSRSPSPTGREAARAGHLCAGPCARSCSCRRLAGGGAGQCEQPRQPRVRCRTSRSNARLEIAHACAYNSRCVKMVTWLDSPMMYEATRTQRQGCVCARCY